MDNFNVRFGALARLYGREGLSRLKQSRVAVIGLGGVGSWAVEALARSGVGELVLMDLDDVCASNVNRQLHALDGQLGRPKVEVMGDRVRTINPDCIVQGRREFFTATTAPGLFEQPLDFVLDAIDSPSKKCLLLALCREKGVAAITTGGSGGRRDPTRIRVTDLAVCSHDRLLQEVRKKLRVKYKFPRKAQLFGVEAVYSPEPPVFAHPDGSVCGKRTADPDLRLDCHSGFGSASFVTGAFGLVAAGRIVTAIADAGTYPPKSA